MRGLSEADRKALAIACGRPNVDHSPLTEAVEQVVACHVLLAEEAVRAETLELVDNHVTAALNKAAVEIDAWAENANGASKRTDDPDAFIRSRVRYLSYRRAADIVRAATPKPPEVVRRPQPRGSGE